MNKRTILAAAFLWGFSASAGAQASSVNGQIAYTVCEYDSTVGAITCDIWRINADGTDPINLTNTPAVSETNPVWSPDGTRIAYVADIGAFTQSLWIMEADGAGPFQVTQQSGPLFGPTWSPGGTELAFARQAPGVVISLQFDIFVVNADGTVEINITNSDFDEIDPSWSPDGARIAFAGVRPETYQDPETGLPVLAAQWEIVTVAPSGSSELVLSAGEPGTERGDHLEEDRGPVWSPDGSMLTFMSQSVDPCCSSWQTWAVNRDGTGITNLTSDESVNDMFQTWSPDGTLILFSRADGLGGLDLYTMPAPITLPPPAAAVATAAPDVVRLTTGANASDPDWGRDPDSATAPGRFALFASVKTNTRLAGGSITSKPAGVRCGRDCVQSYRASALVRLTANARRGFTFVGWSGACTGIAACAVTMDDVQVVRATFRRGR